MLNSPNAGNKEKDAALHMIGVLVETLGKRQPYKSQIDTILTTYILSELQNPAGHMRGRACWTLQYFSEVKFNNPEIVKEIMRVSANALLNDCELPVKVEAGIALQIFINSQPQAAKYIEGQIKDITKELLSIIRDTENEDLMSVLQRIVYTFSDQLLPVAVEICEHLANTLFSVINIEDAHNEKIITAMSLLNALETLLLVMEDQPLVLVKIHPIVLAVVGRILQYHISGTYWMF